MATTLLKDLMMHNRPRNLRVCLMQAKVVAPELEDNGSKKKTFGSKYGSKSAWLGGIGSNNLPSEDAAPSGAAPSGAASLAIVHEEGHPVQG